MFVCMGECVSVWLETELIWGWGTAGMNNDETNIFIKTYFYKHEWKTVGIWRPRPASCLLCACVWECVYLSKHDWVCLTQCWTVCFGLSMLTILNSIFKEVSLKQVSNHNINVQRNAYPTNYPSFTWCIPHFLQNISYIILLRVPQKTYTTGIEKNVILELILTV